MSGCQTSTSQSLESHIQERAATGGAIELPAEVGGERWDELLVVCPYDAQPEGVDPALAEAASQVDTDRTDASQWLLFAADDDVRTLALDRSTVDFCTGSRHEPATYSPETRWTAVQENEVVTLSTGK
ncbi:hypothetical protein [Zhihengliuella halotolerans]|uniref:hypothetical protein n=1 Tax=Zhihengliuella halotolerans TaxID=370736 RepID=UPI0015E154E9|nr:hypothetical protein [Zhihengliuella halotolerans]